MNSSELFELWAPPASVWSPWAKPVLFAEVRPELMQPPMDQMLPRIDVRRDENTAIIVDLPAADSVKTGLALAHDGYRPVPLYNGSPGPSFVLASSALISVESIVQWLVHGAEHLAALSISSRAPPAFLLDANRKWGGALPAPGRFDNRWVVFPQDFPSANFLLAHGIQRVLLFQESGRTQPQPDLAHVLLRWQEAKVELFLYNPVLGPHPQPLAVSRPRNFKSLWYRALAMMGLRRNSAGGFGSVVPEPSSSRGYG